MKFLVRRFDKTVNGKITSDDLVNNVLADEIAYLATFKKKKLVR
jgi:hypothetical protein